MNIDIRSRRAEKRIEQLISEIEEYEGRLTYATADYEIHHLKEMIVYRNEAIVAIIRNLL